MAEEHPLKTKASRANALARRALRENLKGVSAEIVFVDVPYGLHSQWCNPNANSESDSPLWRMLDALFGVLEPASIVAVVSNKRQKASHEGYQRIEHFQVGKRRVVLLKPTPG